MLKGSIGTRTFSLEMQMSHENLDYQTWRIPAGEAATLRTGMYWSGEGTISSLGLNGKKEGALDDLMAKC